MMSTTPNFKATLRRLPMIVTVALLSACGGSGGGTASTPSAPQNKPPVAQNLTLSLPQGSFITFSLQGTDPENDALAFTNSTLPTNGAINGPSSGFVAGMSPLEYRPDASFSGLDKLIFTLDDGNGGTSQGTITFYVQPYANSNADTDGDGLSDTREIQLGTSPILADTDGDGFSDYQEVVTYAFNKNVNNLRFNPLIADTPKIQIDVTSPPDFALNYTTDAGTTTSISTNNAITNGSTVSTSSSNEKTNSWAYANSIGAEITVGYSTGIEGGWSGSATASYGHEETVTNDSTVAFTSENAVENSTTVDRGQAFESSNNISYASGDINTTVRITNSGHITYTLDNLFLSAFTISKGPKGEEFGSVGQMAFTEVGNAAFPALSLAPGQTTTQLNFSTAGLDLGQIQSLMQNSVGLTIKPAIYNLLDANGKAYNFSATNIDTQTAKVIVDFVNNGGRKTIEEAVAVHADPAKNLTILDALQSTLKLNTTIADASGSITDTNGNPLVSGAIESIDGLANNGVYAHWMVVHAQQQGNNQINTKVYTTAAEAARWQAKSTNYVGNLVSDIDFSTTVLNAGDVIHLIYLQDDDLDGLSNSEEFLYGTNPHQVDSDLDGIDDNTEVKGWEIAYTDKFGSNITKRVYSDPTKADTDGDGLTDAEELNVATTDPLKRRDPTRADTDGDGLSDKTDDRDVAKLLDVSGYDSSMINNLIITGIVNNIATLSYELPPLLQPPALGSGIQKYTVYLLSKTYGDPASPYPDIDSLPSKGTVLVSGDLLSCASNDPGPTPATCAWTVRDIGIWPAVIFSSLGPAVPVRTFADTMTIPPAGMAYKALVVIDGVFQQYPVDVPASNTTDNIVISMDPGSFTNKKTLMGLHGIPRAKNAWTHSGAEWLLKGSNYYNPYQYWTSDGWTGGGERFHVYDVVSRAQQADLTQWITFAWGATDKGEFIGDYVYSSAAHMNGYLNKTEVGDGQLDIRWQLLFDGTPLFTAPANGEIIDNSLQAEVLDATALQTGPTTTQVTNVGTTNIFQEHGTTFTQMVVTANAGVCHEIKVVIQERDTLKNSFNPSVNETNTYKVCPHNPVDGTWDVYAVGSSQVTNLRKNNVANATLNFTTDWGGTGATLQATVNGSFKVQIK